MHFLGLMISCEDSPWKPTRQGRGRLTSQMSFGCQGPWKLNGHGCLRQVCKLCTAQRHFHLTKIVPLLAERVSSFFLSCTKAPYAPIAALLTAYRQSNHCFLKIDTHLKMTDCLHILVQLTAVIRSASVCSKFLGSHNTKTGVKEEGNAVHFADLPRSRTWRDRELHLKILSQLCNSRLERDLHVYLGVWIDIATYMRPRIYDPSEERGTDGISVPCKMEANKNKRPLNMQTSFIIPM